MLLTLVEPKLREEGCEVEEDIQVGRSVPGCCCYLTYVGWKRNQADGGWLLRRPTVASISLRTSCNLGTSPSLTLRSS